MIQRIHNVNTRHFGDCAKAAGKAPLAAA